LETTVTTQGSDISTNATDITALETTVNDSTTGVAATASGLSTLETTVTTQGTATTTNATDITALETTVNNPTTGVAASASGLSTLSTTVSNQGGAITSSASDITTLNTTVGNNSASIQSHTASINGISAEQFVKVDVNGNVAGYGLYADASSSEFAVNADVFKISDGASKVVPFAVVNGNTYINTALIADASIDSAKIANLTVDMAQVTGVLTASQIGAITVTGSMIEAGAYLTSPVIYGGTITAGTSITSPVITGGTITGSLILSGSTGLATEAGGSHYAYDVGVTMDVASSGTYASVRAQGNIKPYNYGATSPPNPSHKSPASNLWRYRRQYVSPNISGSVYIQRVGGLINQNYVSVQTHCVVTIRLRASLLGAVLASKAFNIQSYYSGDDETKTLNLTGSNNGFNFALSHDYRTESGSDFWTTYRYHRMVSQTMTFTATPASTISYNHSWSTGLVAEVSVSNITTNTATVGTRTVRIWDTAENAY
jgi:hypothetical protein